MNIYIYIYIYIYTYIHNIYCLRLNTAISTCFRYLGEELRDEIVGPVLEGEALDVIVPVVCEKSKNGEVY